MEIAIIAIVFGCMIPISGILTTHKRKMMEMQLRLQQQNGANAQATVVMLQQEIRALRDTTTQYDLSFDTALQRIEHRMDLLERRMQATETAQTAEARVGR